MQEWRCTAGMIYNYSVRDINPQIKDQILSLLETWSNFSRCKSAKEKTHIEMKTKKKLKNVRTKRSAFLHFPFFSIYVRAAVLVLTVHTSCTYIWHVQKLETDFYPSFSTRDRTDPGTMENKNREHKHSSTSLLKRKMEVNQSLLHKLVLLCFPARCPIVPLTYCKH